MKQLVKFLPLFTLLVVLLASCTKDGVTVVVPDDGTSGNGNDKGVTLSGEIDAGTDIRSVVVGPGPDFKYLWSNSGTLKTQDIYLYFKQNKTNGTNHGFIKTTLTIDPTVGRGRFKVTLSSSTGVGTWFVPGRDSVAGAIDVDPANPPTTTNPGNWGFRTPTSIDGNGPTTLPMFFPLTLSELVSGTSSSNYVGRIWTTFNTLGSVLAFEITNNTSSPYTPVTFTTGSKSFRTSGTTTWNVSVAGRRTGNYPGWVNATANGSAAADTTVTINSISNFTVPANGGKKTFYLWVAQNGTEAAPVYESMVARMRSSTPTSTTPTNVADRITVRRPARTSALANNYFYTVKMTVQSDLMITEVAEGGYEAEGGAGGFYEIYNGSDVTVDLKDYWIDGSQTSSAYAPVPLSMTSRPLASKAIVTLVLPPKDGGNKTLLDNIVKTFKNSGSSGTITASDTLWLGNMGAGNAGENYYRPFYQGRLIRLGKYLYSSPATAIPAGATAQNKAAADDSWVIDFVNLEKWFNNSSVTDLRRNIGINYPTPINEFAMSQWNIPGTQNKSNFGIR